MARNPCVRKLLEAEARMPLTVPENPQTVGALGAAIHAARALANSSANH